jgi:hypothetical protein
MTENSDSILSERRTRASAVPGAGLYISNGSRAPRSAHPNFLLSPSHCQDGELEFCRYPALPYSHSLP